jgi:hypothetical protein
MSARSDASQLRRLAELHEQLEDVRLGYAVAASPKVPGAANLDERAAEIEAELGLASHRLREAMDLVLARQNKARR